MMGRCGLWRLMMIRIGCLAASLLGASVTRGQVQLRPVFEKGQSVRYDLEAAFEVVNKVKGEEIGGRTLNQSMRLRFTTAEVDDDGTAHVRMMIEQIEINFSERNAGGDADQAWNWSADAKPDEPDQTDPTELETLYRAFLTGPTEFVIGPDGRIRRLILAGYDGPQDPRASRMLGVLSPSGMRSVLGAIWLVDPQGLPRRQGDSWDISDESRTGEVVIRRTTHLALDQLRGQKAIIKGPLVYELIRSPHESDSSRPEFSILDHSGEVSMIWDTQAGRLVSREEDRRTTWHSTLLGGAVSAVTTSQSQVQCRLVE